jgi:HJR/Mrr/RecB family endonuclease/putative component of toxin-antitoxin plasmid stabilization module
MLPILQGFIEEYRTKGVPPPYILLVGKDEGQNERIFQEFIQKLGIEGKATKSADVTVMGDLTSGLTWRKVAYLSNVEDLKREWTERLIEIISTGELKIVIGEGPGRRVHLMQFTPVAFVASCSAKDKCPSSLLKQFQCVIPVEPHTTAELLGLLEAEAGKDRISFEPGAAELLVTCCGGLSSVLSSRFRKVIALIDQVKQTNKPCLTVAEIEMALAKLRIEIPRAIIVPSHRQLDDLSGIEFESLVKALLIEMGFHADLTEVTGDGGIDIVATLDKPFCGGRYIFQCKRYARDNFVGAPALRDFYGAVTADRAVKGIFITTSEFTNQAKDFAAQVGIELVNRGRLNQLLGEYKVGV